MATVHSTRLAPTRKAFSALPHDLQDDPRLKPRDLTTIASILRFAITKSWASMSNRSLARMGRCSERTIQLSLARLEKAGWIRREPTDADVGSKTGRLVYLVWREGAMDGVGVAPRIAPQPVNPIAPELEGEREKEKPAMALDGPPAQAKGKKVEAPSPPTPSAEDRAVALREFEALPVGHPMRGLWRQLAGLEAVKEVPSKRNPKGKHGASSTTMLPPPKSLARMLGRSLAVRG